MLASRSPVWILSALLAFASGCTGTFRHSAPPLQYGDALPVGFPSSVRIVNDTQRAFEARAPQILARVHAAAADRPINTLALSGGGVGAAFGAGALVGWTRGGTRPEFQIVTGVSAGALIAPFAFLGPSWDEQLTDVFSGARTQYLLQPRWMSALLSSSVYRGKPLLELVDRYVTAKVLQAVAAEAAKGRLLLVATTDLDKEQTVIWNLGVVAAQGGERARRLFRDVIVASASIPGLFPPVLIRVTQAGLDFDEMHIDGGTSAALFIAPELASLLPVDVNLLGGANVYIIVNGQFGVRGQTTPMRTLPIVKRSVMAALQSSSLAAVEIALSLARRNGMQLWVTEIPTNYPYLGPLDVEPSRMKTLFTFGDRCGQQGRLWATPIELLDRVESDRRMPLGMEAECPGASQSDGSEPGR